VQLERVERLVMGGIHLPAAGEFTVQQLSRERGDGQDAVIDRQLAGELMQ